MRIKVTLCLFLSALSMPSLSQAQGCKDPELREKVARVAKEEGVDEKELLSIIAHESSCHYFVIAWNLPKQPKTAQSKFFSSLEEAKIFAEEMIATGQYRVDVGIGQINYEANIKPRRWVLEEVLHPKTALHRVAKVLKEQSWAHYHSSNPVYAKKWQVFALAALDPVLSDSNSSQKRVLKTLPHENTGELVIFNRLESLQIEKAQFEEAPRKVPIISLRTNRNNSPLVIFPFKM